MIKREAAIIGSGLTGAVAAHELSRNGWDVVVYEALDVTGGNVRTEQLNGVLYEPHGAHIFHTKDSTVYDYLNPHWSLGCYTHRVKTRAFGRLLSWPPQLDELRELSEWPKIEAELASRPGDPDSTNFETYAMSLVGPTLYEELIAGYTRKQWGASPSSLSSSFAPKRIDLRDDGYLGLFYDTYQGWPVGGWMPLIDSLLQSVTVHTGIRVQEEHLDSANWDAIIVTAPLDDFLELPALPWRGVSFTHTYTKTAELNDVVLPAAVVNQPSSLCLHTRTIETKQMSGQQISGTVVSYEYPGSSARHYPIDDAEGKNRARANEYRAELVKRLPNAIPAGRLANYVYIDTDQAVRQGLNASREAIRRCKL